MHNLKRKFIKGTAALLASITVASLGVPANAVSASASYDYSNAIYSEGTQDTYLYEANDKVITTKTGIKRTIPKTTGAYERSDYPIPLINKVPSEETFELIKAENKELMDQVETAISKGTLTKHIAADGQFYGSISDEVLGVEKKVYVNTNSKGTHSLASYVPAGEVATVTLSEEALKYVKKGQIKLSVGMTSNHATSYEYNNGTNNRMPYLGKTFSVSGLETKVGTPFGGMVFIEIDSQVPSGLQLEVEVKGVVDTPYYDLGQTTSEEWKKVKDAPGLFTEIRTPYLRFVVPSYFIRETEDPYQACLFWTKATTLSATLMAQEERTTPMTIIFDEYITAGIAYAVPGAWYCVVPNDWITSALDYEELMKSGNWGMIHEINHHYQSRYASYYDEWGVGEDFGEVTNNVLSAISYILYTNIASYRGEDGLEDWNKVADPYSSLKQQMYEGVKYYDGVPNMGNFAFSTLAHEIGPVTLAEVIKSTYDGGTFNGIELPAYDYKAESEGKKTRKERYDDMAYRICVASKRDYTWYLKEELGWPLTNETVKKIEAQGYEQVIPVQSVYAMGEVGRETGRPYYVPSTGYVFDFEESLVSPGETTVVDVSAPKYGTMKPLEDGTYSYMPDTNQSEDKMDEFTLTVLVEADGITRETKLNCKVGLLYDSVSVEHHEIKKWNIYDALETLKTSTPYKTTTSSGMRITTDDGNNLAKTTGYFSVSKSGKYTFQAYGDDCAVFELQQEDGTALQSLTVDYTATVEAAYQQEGATHFTAYLKADTPYAYTLIANNNTGAGWADVSIRSTDQDSKWEAVTSVCGNLNDFGKGTERVFEEISPVYVRPSKLAASNASTIKGVSVISTPQGVAQNNDPNSRNEGNPANIVDGDVSTYFHSSYTASDKTPMPHDYVFDLGSEQSFNQINILYRRTGDDCGVIGNYEIYVAEEYKEDDTSWTLVAQDDKRNGNASAPSDIQVSLNGETARYVMLRVLNNRGSYDLSILAEVTFSTNSTVTNVIAQNSSYIQYEGKWSKDTDGVFVNGAAYRTLNGYFMYCFNGKESNLYVTKDTKAQIRVDGGEWKTISLTGSLREPSYTVSMPSDGEHSVEVRGIGEELSLNMISTDGTFYKGSVVSTSNTIAIHGASDLELPVGKVSSFDALEGISYSDDFGLMGLEIKVAGELGTPAPGSKKAYKLSYTVTDYYKNTASVDRVITVTNQLPKIEGLSDLTISEGEGKNFDYSKGVTATDYEDGMDVTLELPVLDLSTLSAGTYTVEYKAKDSDGNLTAANRTIYVKKKGVSVVPLPGVKKLKATAVFTNQVTITWSKVSGATGYKVYRYNSSKKKYELIRTITKNTTVSYKDSNVVSGTTYKYRVAAYKKTETGTVAQLSVTTKPDKVKISKLTTTSKKATIRWKKVTRASGYEVYRSTSKKGTYKKVGTIKKAKTVTFTNKKLKGNTTYYYKVRAYKVVNGKKIYGSYSKVNAIKVKK